MNEVALDIDHATSNANLVDGIVYVAEECRVGPVALDKHAARIVANAVAPVGKFVAVVGCGFDDDSLTAKEVAATCNRAPFLVVGRHIDGVVEMFGRHKHGFECGVALDDDSARVVGVIVAPARELVAIDRHSTQFYRRTDAVFAATDERVGKLLFGQCRKRERADFGRIDDEAHGVNRSRTDRHAERTDFDLHAVGAELCLFVGLIFVRHSDCYIGSGRHFVARCVVGQQHGVVVNRRAEACERIAIDVNHLQRGVVADRSRVGGVRFRRIFGIRNDSFHGVREQRCWARHAFCAIAHGEQHFVNAVQAVLCRFVIVEVVGANPCAIFVPLIMRHIGCIGHGDGGRIKQHDVYI